MPYKKTGGKNKKEKDDARISTSREREKTPEMAGEAGARPGGSCRKKSTLSTLENKENRDKHGKKKHEQARG